MQRYFVPDINFEDDTVRIEGEDARHIQKVMRMSPNDQVIVCNFSEEAFLCVISTLQGPAGEVIAIVKEKLATPTEMPINVTIVQGLVKGDKLDWVVQKGTELGAASFIPFQAERSVVKWDGGAKISRKRERLEKIAKEAAEQAHRLKVPSVRGPLSLEEVIKESEQYDACLVAYEEEAKQGKQSGLPTLLERLPRGASLLAIIGPEGGLSEREVQALQAHGFMACGLGRRILRAETASLYLLSALSFYYELQRGE
ncbi:16S rRNA (uracil1498-N3)-methyltransferase [Pullulanibacillus pueri]|uniref:Ribosomal RNA small subunit methyltransferase E n=1 Tax=Pullulanibacillus pueri TaxID=1437324 RepID=A0A8J2ZXS7_9BACL|nr:16S rRNA (uracil(1498)-N(3))-methyltransferase [Pullulanibacillus pueri]MBM7683056.1 16S rRNA (uracil1498-N3)-methyltransferase [Pullulanibacillus pueri]GGH84940.1 ribosomal RNA small subunit methyltransferase E [Pullulanibacillus pueri]